MEAYKNLIQRAHEIAFLANASHLLSWDQETYMPPKAIDYRAEQLAYFSGRTHELFTDPQCNDWLKACEDHSYPENSDEAVNIREWRHSYDRATKLPTEHVEELERTTSMARNAWIEARQKSDFSIFKPHLEKIVELTLRSADYWGYDESPYDALLEGFEPGASTSEIQDLFAELRPAIVPIVQAGVEKSKNIPKDFLKGDYPITSQQALNKKIASTFGFDLEAGRIDTTTHPFCSGIAPADCRITTRYDEKDFTSSLLGVLHETGHGLYEQGLPIQHHGTPRGDSISLGIHESQSRFWENHIGRSLSFWRYWYPEVCNHFPNLKKFTPEEIHAAINRVDPSFIRVESDEVTYDLHIILRFKIELKLITKQITVADIPSIWNQHFEEMFSLKVPDDANGCLQDIHWSLGCFGYFPTYTLGNLNASQFYHCLKPTIINDLENGNYTTTLAWLRENIHSKGKTFRAQQLMQNVTGQPTQTSYHLEHLKRITTA